MARQATDQMTTISIHIGKNGFHLIGLDRRFGSGFTVNRAPDQRPESGVYGECHRPSRSARRRRGVIAKTVQHIHVGGTVISGLSIAVLCLIVKGICSLVFGLPGLAKLALLVGIAGAALHPESREKILNVLQNTGTMIADIWPEVERLLELASKKQMEAEIALSETRRLAQS